MSNKRLPQNTSDTSDTADELWQLETHLLVLSVFRARVLMVPLLLFFSLLFLLFDPVPWKLTLLLGGTICVIVLFTLEYRRLRSWRATERTIHVNLLYGVIIQSVVIYITGGIASPVMASYVPIVVLTGLSLHSAWRIASVVSVPVAVLTVLSLGTWTGLVPSVIPAFYGEDGPLLQDKAWLFTRTGVILLIVVLGIVIGLRVRATFDRVVLGATRLRQSELDTLESRNRDILSTGVTIAHELKNPLSSIQGLTQLMARSIEPGTKDRERVDVILREIQRMTTVLDEFRGFTRPLSGLTRSPVALSQLASAVIALHEGSAATRGVRLAFRTAGESEAVCDAQKVKQALVNLIQNALEASPRGSEVIVSVIAESDETVALRVRDHGPGIDEDLRHRLFAPGFTTKERGTGIGLVVARSVIEQHGGKLELVSRASNGSSEGTEAVITLPRKAPDAEAQP